MSPPEDVFFVVIFGAFIKGMGGHDTQCITREGNRDGVNSIAGRFGGLYRNAFLCFNLHKIILRIRKSVSSVCHGEFKGRNTRRIRSRKFYIRTKRYLHVVSSLSDVYVRESLERVLPAENQAVEYRHTSQKQTETPDS
jgi:hypothetical protein